MFASAICVQQIFMNSMFCNWSVANRPTMTGMKFGNDFNEDGEFSDGGVTFWLTK